MTKEELTSLLQAANSYYNGRNTGMTDQQYDELLEKAKQEIPNFNIFDRIVIGTDRSSVKHSYPFTAEEFKHQFSTPEEFYDATKNLNGWYATPKWDGCSIRAYYVNGVLTDIITRSDEVWGKRKYDQLKNKVPNLVDPSVICIDFEALCSKEDFGDSRSHANGLVNSCNQQDEVDKKLQLIPFKVTANNVLDYKQAMNLVFKDDNFIILQTIDPTNRFIEFKGKHYPIDGYVYYNDTLINHKIYKFYYNQVPVTEVTKVSWNYSGNLCWTPTVIFKPVKIDGRTASAASSNGYSRLKYLKVGVGAKIEIILANSTIPQIHKVLEPSENYTLPELCPFCGAKLELVCDKFRCSNLYCSDLVNNFGNILFKIMNKDFQKQKVTTIEEVKNIFNTLSSELTNEELIEKFINRLPIDRFKKQKEFIKAILDNKEVVLNGSTRDLKLWMFTENQYLVYKHYSSIVDDIIRMIMNRSI